MIAQFLNQSSGPNKQWLLGSIRAVPSSERLSEIMDKEDPLGEWNWGSPRPSLHCKLESLPFLSKWLILCSRTDGHWIFYFLPYTVWNSFCNSCFVSPIRGSMWLNLFIHRSLNREESLDMICTLTWNIGFGSSFSSWMRFHIPSLGGSEGWGYMWKPRLGVGQPKSGLSHCLVLLSHSPHILWEPLALILNCMVWLGLMSPPHSTLSASVIG